MILIWTHTHTHMNADTDTFFPYEKREKFRLHFIDEWQTKKGKQKRLVNFSHTHFLSVVRASHRIVSYRSGNYIINICLGANTTCSRPLFFYVCVCVHFKIMDFPFLLWSLASMETKTWWICKWKWAKKGLDHICRVASRYIRQYKWKKRIKKKSRNRFVTFWPESWKNCRQINETQMNKMIYHFQIDHISYRIERTTPFGTPIDRIELNLMILLFRLWFLCWIWMRSFFSLLVKWTI